MEKAMAFSIPCKMSASSGWYLWRVSRVITARLALAVITGEPSRQSIENWLEGGIEGLIGFISVGIKGLNLRMRRGPCRDLHSCFTGLPYGGIEANGDACQQGSAEGGSLLGICSYEFHTQYVSDDLTPEGTFRASTGGTYLLDGQPLFADNVEAVFEAEGDTFQHGTHQVASIMAGGETEPAAARVRVQVGSAFPLQVGQEEKTFAAGRY